MSIIHPGYEFNYCALCFVTTGKKSKFSSLADYNDHFTTQHHTPWRLLGQVGANNLVVGDPIQFLNHPEVLEEMYQSIVNPDAPGGVPQWQAREFVSGNLVTDVQAVVVSQSDMAEGGCVAFGKVGSSGMIDVPHYQEVRVVWSADDIATEKDTEFLVFALSVFVVLTGFDEESVDRLKAVLDRTESR